MALDPAVRAIVTKINRKHGAGTVVVGSEITQQVLPRIPSGSLSLDIVLGGGWVTNQWVEVIGHPSVGKTFLTLKTIAVNQRRDPKWTVVWFATEEFVESYAEMLGCDLSRILVIDSNTMEEVYQWAHDFLLSKSVDCIVIDSLPNLVPIRETEGSYEDFQPGLRAFLTGKFFRMTRGAIKRSLVEDERACLGIVINQWREKIVTMGDPRTTPGGKGKDFAFFQRIEVRRDDWITNSKNHPVGQTLKIVNIKNKVAPPQRTAFIDAYFANGNGHKAGSFDQVKDMVAAAEAQGLIEVSGSWLQFLDHKYHGRAQFAEALAGDKVLQRELHRSVMRSLQRPAPKAAPKKKVP